MTTIRCSKCSQVVLPDAKFCQYCGAPADMNSDQTINLQTKFVDQSVPSIWKRRIRWNIFLTIKNQADALDLVLTGATVAFIVSGLNATSFIMSGMPSMDSLHVSFNYSWAVSAAIYAFCGIGLAQYWSRAAAIALLILMAIGVLVIGLNIWNILNIIAMIIEVRATEAVFKLRRNRF
jgi:hypothetical protein